MTAHEVVIRLGRPFDIRTNGGAFLAGVWEITVPFDDEDSAEDALLDVRVTVRRVHDAGGEDYRPVVAGEVMPDEFDRAIVEQTARMRQSIIAPKMDLGDGGRAALARDRRDLAELDGY